MLSERFYHPIVQRSRQPSSMGINLDEFYRGFLSDMNLRGGRWLGTLFIRGNLLLAERRKLRIFRYAPENFARLRFLTLLRV